MTDQVMCDFQTSRKLDEKGIDWKKGKLGPCGEPGAFYRCEGEISSLVMPLCDRHCTFVREQYKWTTVRVDEEKL